MKTGLKKFLACSTIVALLGTCCGLKVCKDKSEQFADSVISYTNSFVDDDFAVAAHRGFSSIEVENTVDALTAARNAKFIDYIEFDVRLTSDGKLVVAHNDFVVCENGDNVSISEIDYKDISNSRYRYLEFNKHNFICSFINDTEGAIIRERMVSLLGDRYSIIELEQALTVCGDKPILLDLKFENDFFNFTEALMEVINEQDECNVILQSADLIALRALQNLYPNFKYAAIVNNPEDFQYCDSFHMLGVRKNLIDSNEVEAAIANGKSISVWTVNTMADLEKVTCALGDNYDDIIYITDYPDVIASHLNSITLEKKKATTQ